LSHEDVAGGDKLVFVEDVVLNSGAISASHCQWLCGELRLKILEALVFRCYLLLGALSSFGKVVKSIVRDVRGLTAKFAPAGSQ
jgi:hypothetical protein